VLGVLMKLLHEAGYLPALDQCAHCGSGGLALAFSPSRGVVVCECSVGEGVPLSPEAVAAMRSPVEPALAELRTQVGDPGAAEALRHIHQLYVHETGSRPRALHFAQARP
jgi:recombinational DNA repair protein (RecF pathway)